MIESMQQVLQAYVTQTFSDKEALQVSELTNLSAGWESDVHAFTLTHGIGEDQQREELILRILQTCCFHSDTVDNTISCPK